MLPIGSILVSAGESSIKLWDLHGGGRLIHEFSHHQKLVSALCFDSQQSRLLSASLDRMVKCYDVTDFQVVHSMKFPEPILCMQLSPDFSKLVVGQSTGQLIIRRRELPQENGLIESSAKKLRGGTYKYFVRGQDELPSQDDFKIEHVRKQQLRPYDAFLKKFQYHDALNAALESRNPIVVISLLDELIQRDCLGTALSGRDEVSLEPLLHFIIKQITNPHFNMLLNRVSHAVLDIYSTSVGHSVLVHQMLVSLQTKLRDEIRLQKDMFRLLGSLELLLAASQLKGGAEIK
jgi:U3 small nucleolar RNA-associated protein 15